MSDEIKKSAERLRADSWDIYGIRPKRDDEEWAALADKLTADGRALADAYCPADSDEQIDEAWLRSVGFAIEGTHLAFAGIQACHRKTADAFVWQWYLFGGRIPALKTRGDVRRLCAALSIPLTAKGAS